MTCTNCKQQILPGQPNDDATFGTVDTRRVYHANPADCVAATVAATAQKCAEIAEEARYSQESVDTTVAEIRRAYPSAFAKEEGK